MKSRDWLIKQGHVKQGARGRISQVAKQALADAIANGMTFDDVTNDNSIVEIKRDTRPTAPALAKNKLTHQYSTFYGIEQIGGRVCVFGFDTCHGCHKYIKFCTHDVPKLPAWLPEQVATFEKPKEGVNL